MKLESYWLFKGILLMFNFILVVSTGYILLFSICPMLKPEKIQRIASSTTLENLVKNYFKGAKIWWFFSQLYKSLIDCFVLEFWTVDTE